MESKSAKGTAIEPVDAAYCSYPQRQGNIIDVFVDGASFYRHLTALIAKAKKRVWVIGAFVSPAWKLPSDAGSPTLFELLDAAARRGLDVRVLFWRATGNFGGTFNGDSKQREAMASLKLKARWDSSGSHGRAHCHHQKSWIVDGTAFVGGMGVSSDHDTDSRHLLGNTHDLFAQLTGPIAADVEHNFVQRWNEARGHDAKDGSGCFPDLKTASNLPFPKSLPAEGAGSVTVQLQRTIRPDDYTDSTATPGGSRFAVSGGEDSILRQYSNALRAARSCVYLENQHVAHGPLLQLLREALERGVVVVYVAPTRVMHAVHQAKLTADQWVAACKKAGSGAKPERPRYAEIFVDHLVALSEFPNFCLVGLASCKAADQHSKAGGAGSPAGDSKSSAGTGPRRRVGGEKAAAGAGVESKSGSTGGSENADAAADSAVEYQTIYVHSKLCIVDGVWFTVGSANLVDISFEKDHTEMNVSIWDEGTARTLLLRLVAEHLGMLPDHGDHTGGGGLAALNLSTLGAGAGAGAGSSASKSSGSGAGGDLERLAKLSPAELLRKMQAHARANTARLIKRRRLHGHAFALDPTEYGNHRLPTTLDRHYDADLPTDADSEHKYIAHLQQQRNRSLLLALLLCAVLLGLILVVLFSKSKGAAAAAQAKS